jgi:hypothetical protein
LPFLSSGGTGREEDMAHFLMETKTRTGGSELPFCRVRGECDGVARLGKRMNLIAGAFNEER